MDLLKNNDLFKLLRLFFFLTAVIFCAAGMAVGAVNISERSKSRENAEQPVKIEQYFSDFIADTSL